MTYLVKKEVVVGGVTAGRFKSSEAANPKENVKPNASSTLSSAKKAKAKEKAVAQKKLTFIKAASKGRTCFKDIIMQHRSVYVKCVRHARGGSLKCYTALGYHRHWHNRWSQHTLQTVLK